MRRGWVRVIGGALRGRRLLIPRDLECRPTGDRVREALFNVLGTSVVGARVLDAYAGTGALGIEALSRGASSACFVERSREVLERLRKNLDCDASVSTRARLIEGDLAAAMGILAREGSPFDLVFLDPPYGAELDRGLRLIGRGGILASDATVVAEHEFREPPGDPPGLVLRDRRRYGRTALSFFRPEAAGSRRFDEGSGGG